MIQLNKLLIITVMKMKSVFVLGFMLLATGAFAQQNLKIGYTNVDYILSLMPETKQVESEFSAYQKQIENQLQAKITEFQTKGQEYQQTVETMTDVVRADKEAELQSLQQRIEKFQRDSQSSLQKKQAELFQPLFDKIGTAINAVGKENGYSHIFSSGAPGMDVLLYASDDSDCTDLVLQKLGIDPPANGQ